MDEHIVIDRNRSVNVWASDGDVCLTVDSGDDRAYVPLNPAQARRLADLLVRVATACESD